jgi:hypothetical protein
MSFFQEPTNTEGVNQIIDSGDGQGKNAKAWLNTKDNSSKPRFSVWCVGADAVAWLAGAGVLARLTLLIQKALELSLLPEVSAILFLLICSSVLFYCVYRMRPSDRFYRLVLFTFGILIAVL